MTVMPLEYVAAPALTPPKYGLLSAAVVIDDPDPHAGFGFEYEADFCGAARLTAVACQTAATKVAEDGLDIVHGSPFAVYSLASCRTVGGNDMVERARRSLTSGEGRAVEEWMNSVLDADADIATWTAPTYEGACAALEQYIACEYGGAGTLHMQRGVAALLLGKGYLTTDGNRLVTKLGNVVASGCYYPVASPPDHGKPVNIGASTIYATGTVVLRRGAVAVTPAVVDTSTNDVYALAERPYAGSYECFAVGVNVEPS